MNSTHRQNQALLSLPLWCILTAHIPATGKRPFPSILGWKWSDFLMHHRELLILKLVQWLSGRCPRSFLLLRCRSSVSFPYDWRSVLHKSWCLKEKTMLQAGVGKVKMQSLAWHNIMLLRPAEWTHDGTKQSANRLRNQQWGQRDLKL